MFFPPPNIGVEIRKHFSAGDKEVNDLSSFVCVCVCVVWGGFFFNFVMPIYLSPDGLQGHSNSVNSGL